MAVAKQPMQLVGKDNLAGKFWLLKLAPTQPFKFAAGQYLSLRVDDTGLRRAYSIASSPSQLPIELLVDVTPMGIGSRYILGLQPGDKVEALGPLGRFGVDGHRDKKLFVATGCGIVPLRSMILDLLATNRPGAKHLVWGMRQETDLLWQEEFGGLAQRHSDLGYDIILSRPSRSWQGKAGHVADVLKDRGWAGWEVYLCGSQAMISQLSSWFINHKVAQHDIHFEKFY